MWRTGILRALADYASTLSDGLEHAVSVEDRETYLSGLSFVGRLFAKIHDAEPYSVLAQIVEDEEKNPSWTLLSGDDGKVAEEAWATFRKLFATALSDGRT